MLGFPRKTQIRNAGSTSFGGCVAGGLVAGVESLPEGRICAHGLISEPERTKTNQPTNQPNLTPLTSLARERARCKELLKRYEELRAENSRVRAEIAKVLLENIQLRRDLRITLQTDPTSNVTPMPVLTDREREVVALIVKGESTKQVAFNLGISFKTAVTHRCNAMKKLQVHETASLVRVAIREGLVDIA